MMGSNTNGSCASDTGIVSDEQLLEHFALEQCDPCFCELHRRYDGQIKNLLSRKYLIHNRAAVDDVTQVTWLRVHTSHHTFKQGSKVRPWLLSIAVNCAIDTERVRNRTFAHYFSEVTPGIENGAFSRPRQVRLDPVDSTDPVDPESNIAVESVQQDDLINHIRTIISSLSEADQAAIDLVFFQNMTRSEAAKALGIPLGSICTRIARAMTYMRNRLILPDAEVA